MDGGKKMEPREERDSASQEAAAASPAAARVASSALDDAAAARPTFGRLGLGEEADRVEMRSIKIGHVPAPPALGMMHSGPSGLNMGFDMSALSFKGPAQQKKMGLKQPSVEATSSVRVDRTNYVNVAPRDLPPPPFRLEMHTHFHAKLASVARVCAVVGRKLCELDTDYEFKADKCKWKVEFRRAVPTHQRVNLNIVIFKAGKELVVEVQRREGDITALMALYAELKNYFKRNQLLVEKNAPTNGGVKRPAPKPMSPTPALSAASVRDGVSALKGLLSSKYADVQMQGVLGAISLSARAASSPEMATLVPQLVALAQSSHAGVSRLVGVALARLCDHPECRQALVQSEGWQFIVDCAAGGDSVTAEVQRESLRVVESLCPLYHDELAKTRNAARVLELVRDWQAIEDPRLRKHACGAHRALQDAGVLA
jgi:hypothetical protein